MNQKSLADKNNFFEILINNKPRKRSEDLLCIRGIKLCSKKVLRMSEDLKKSLIRGPIILERWKIKAHFEYF